MTAHYNPDDNRISALDAIECLATLLNDAQPYGVFLNPTTYARELLAQHETEQAAIREHRWVLTPLEECIP